MFKADVNPLTRFVSTVAFATAPGFWMAAAIIVIMTALSMLMNATQVSIESEDLRRIFLQANDSQDIFFIVRGRDRTSDTTNPTIPNAMEHVAWLVMLLRATVKVKI